uniref:Disease resistance N-terminal domain-containing protein n=1 Tax=Setaria italica TaxID=4555 RepID=K4A194_SETIT
MDAVISAIIGELATRSLSQLIDKYLKPATSKEEGMQRLQWMLLRVRLTVEEAEGRCITNQAMLQQLNILRKVVYKGYYMLDTFRCHAPEEEKGKKGHGMKITIAGMSELLIFLRNYPPMFRQPYNTYLFVEKCMFGRQMEMERVINFLLNEESPVHCNFGVLPIVGPEKVGKTTLVEHMKGNDDFREEKQLKIRDGSRIKHKRAYWYFFKALVFGSANPEEQPRLASIAMAIFDEYFDQDVYKAFAGPFIYLNKTAMGLKSSVNAQNWNRILACFKDNRRQNEPGFRKSLSDCRMNSDHIFLQRVVDSSQYCVVHNHDRIALVNEEAPKITLHDILDGTGSVRPHEKIDILVWESHLPPYHKYIYSCQILERDCKVTRKKQGEKRKISS